MRSICLTKFNKNPWENVMMEGFKKALKNKSSLYNVEEIYGYPQKKYDVIILIGIRSIVKQKLDKDKIIPYCKKLIDMGDSSMDPRRNYEDAYIYFIPSKKKLHKHYHYLPKFILEEHLYPSSKKEDNLNVFVDHFNYQNEDERDISIKVIEKIFFDLRNSDIQLNVFYHTSKGIEKNRFFPEIPKKGISNCSKYIPFEKITEFYRKTDIFFPTHRETQGMLAQEIGACGGLTVLQDWMYPRSTHHQFPAIFYKQDQKIDFKFLQKISQKHSKEEIRKYVLNQCGFNIFESKLNHLINTLFD